MIQIISEKMVKIRKRRQCFGCLRIYDPGSQMNVQTNVFDGDIGHIYTCPTCHRLIERFPEFFIEDGMYERECVRELIDGSEHRGKTPEQLLEFFRDTIGDKLKYQITNE